PRLEHAQLGQASPGRFAKVGAKQPAEVPWATATERCQLIGRVVYHFEVRHLGYHLPKPSLGGHPTQVGNFVSRDRIAEEKGNEAKDLRAILQISTLPGVIHELGEPRVDRVRRG